MAGCFDWTDSLMGGVELFDDRNYQLPTSRVDPVTHKIL